jgi:hypothetical protein
MQTDDDRAVPSGRGKRLPYEPPAIEETSDFETLALTCGHTTGFPGPCDEYTGTPGS